MFFNRIFEILENDSRQRISAVDIGSLFLSARQVRLDCDEVYDKLTQLAVNSLSEFEKVSFVLAPLARCDQAANFNFFLEKAIEAGRLENVTKLVEVIEIASALVLMEKYDSPVLTDMLKRIRDADEKEIDRQKNRMAFFDVVLNCVSDIIDVDPDGQTEAGQVARQITARYQQELQDFEMNYK